MHAHLINTHTCTHTLMSLYCPAYAISFYLSFYHSIPGRAAIRDGQPGLLVCLIDWLLVCLIVEYIMLMLDWGEEVYQINRMNSLKRGTRGSRWKFNGVVRKNASPSKFISELVRRAEASRWWTFISNFSDLTLSPS